MEVHFEKMAERRFAPQTMATDESPAMLVICLIRSLKNWFGQSSRAQTDGSQLQFASGTMSSGTCIFAFSSRSLRQRSVCPGC